MDERDRDKIIANLKSLVEETNDFNKLFDHLKAKGMFNDYMEREILSQEAVERLKFLYCYVTTRGPKAFRQLLDALNATDNGRLASLLADSSYRLVQNGHDSNQPSLEEEYPHSDEWIVKRAIERFDFDSVKVYKMGSKPRGLALIINIEKFVNDVLSERQGSIHDIKRLESILKQLDYEVKVYKELTAREIEEKVVKFARKEDHMKYDSSIVFMMSHGKSDNDTALTHTINFVGSDAQTVNSQWIIDQFMGTACHALSGKPKMFFFQACRGDNLNHNVLTSSPHQHQRDYSPNHYQTDSSRVLECYARNDADILIVNATSPGNVALRDPDWGSWFIQTLCRVFAKYAWDTDIESMLKYVKRELHGLVTCSKTSRGFRKTFYLQPGIYDAELGIATNGI